MKKQKFFLAIICFILSSLSTTNAQWSTSGSNIWTTNTNNNVGIGTMNPDINAKLHIYNYALGVPNLIKLENTYSETDVNHGEGVMFKGYYKQALISAFQNPQHYMGGDLQLQTYYDENTLNTGIYLNRLGDVGIGCDPGSTTLKVYKTDLPTFEIASSISRLQIGMATCNGCFANGAISGDAVIRTIGGNHSLVFSVPDDTKSGNSYFGITDDANGIWAKFCNNKFLRVNGTIVANEINVQTDAWADNVFDSSYKLKTIDEVDTYIKENKHLPDVPSEQEVKENGINLANMNVILLQKVEELTLMMIEQQKQINQLKHGLK